MHRCSHFSFLRLAVRKYSTKFDKTVLQISDEVNSALVESKPIVALESTIITHGMPFPDNIRCALEVENIVRSQGAVPATIALLNGKIKVGMTKAEIEYLGDTQTSKPIKTSRRDFPYLLSMKRNGGTTVSGTIIVSNLVGISVFATGGIGGVHRGAENSFDISADLTELGRSSVAVVSSGVKSILDIPKTLEYMETQGIFVATLGTNREFPAFYSQSSGCIAPYLINDARSAAKVIKSHQDIALQSGILFAVPVPKEYAIDYEVIDNAIEKALEKAKEKGIEGKNITPFLLSEIATITSGNSLTTNIALIKNNAKVASNIAVELEKLKGDNRNIEMKEDDSGEILPAQPVIIGGCNLDCVAHLEASEIKLDGRMHVGRLDYSAGGVGRNICEALGKLGRSSHFISAVGDDQQGRILTRNIPKESSKFIKVFPGRHSAQCIVVLDRNGNCSFLMGDMSIHELITPEVIEQHENIIKKSPLIVLDGNISEAGMDKALEIAHTHNIPVFYEPTDISIAQKPFKTNNWKAIKFITPNLEELNHIYHFLKEDKLKRHNDKNDDPVKVLKYVANVIDNVIVTLGEKGILIARKGLATEPFLLSNESDRISVRHYPVKARTDIVNVSGAGDCFASGLITAFLENLPEETCVSVGFAAAVSALYSQSAVPTEIFTRSHRSWKEKAEYNTL